MHRNRRRASCALLAALLAWLWVALLQASDTGGPACGGDDDACDTAAFCDAGAENCRFSLPRGEGAGDVSSLAPSHLVFFWGVGCPHCEAAKPFVEALAKERPSLTIDRVEVRKDPDGKRQFIATMRELGLTSPGIPAFVVGGEAVIGFSPGSTEAKVRALLRGGQSTKVPIAFIDLPWIGSVSTGEHTLATLALLIGLIDGINPCAMWVLLVLLGVMMHVRSRRRLALVGGLFVLMSGLVYFAFMTVWLELFEYAGLSRPVTIALGIAVVTMGLINIKELIWFKKGVSLTIPERAKPGLYRRMRRVANAASLPAAVVGIALLALLVNLIELGCTLGLPAVFTRILSAKTELGSAERYAYLALYNLAYVVPLAAIVAVYAVSLHRLALTERGAKVLKLVSGVLLLTFGTILLWVPEFLL